MTQPGRAWFPTLLATLVVPKALKLEPGLVRSNMISRYCCSTKVNLVSYFASVDQSLSDRIAKAIGSPTAKPLAVKPASEAVRFRHGVGAAA